MEKIMLFNGRDLTGWKCADGAPRWKVENGVLTVVCGGGNIWTEETFGDAMLHLEWMEPSMPEATGQGKGNSGVYLQGRYEVQVLDSCGAEVPKTDDCGGIYGIAAPLCNACRPALEWQSYDILFRAPRFDDAGNKTENARITVLQNGLPIHNNLELPHITGGPLTEDEGPEGPLMLQDHWCEVSFRNIWLMKL